MAKFEKVICPLCGEVMKQDMSKTLAHFRERGNTIGVYICPKCKCERVITTDDTEDDY